MTTNELTEAKLFKNRKEWREWLEKNHAIIEGLWLIHYKVKSKKVSVSHKDAVEEALCFGWIDSKLKSVDEDRYILRYSSRKGKSVWSKINKDAAEKMISEGKMTKAGIEKINNAKKHGLWKVKTSHPHPSYKLGEWFVKWLAEEEDPYEAELVFKQNGKELGRVKLQDFAEEETGR